MPLRLNRLKKYNRQNNGPKTSINRRLTIPSFPRNKFHRSFLGNVSIIPHRCRTNQFTDAMQKVRRKWSLEKAARLPTVHMGARGGVGGMHPAGNQSCCLQNYYSNFWLIKAIKNYLKVAGIFLNSTTDFSTLFTTYCSTRNSLTKH